ncbi:hypothetical protein, partial [Pseudomonas putida]|uniref:hypothetical protein n=1 Tax=Pseudomonas putida TaxID=303 RepID=UPI001E3D9F4F
RLERDGQLILLLAEGGLRRSVSTLRLAQRHDLRLQRREAGRPTHRASRRKAGAGSAGALWAAA